MAEIKHCPKCKTGKMEDGTLVFILPALVTSMGQQPPISDRAGMPLRTSQCSECRYVEFFSVNM